MKKRNLYIITLEPLEQRYTAQWHKYFANAFSKKFNVINIDGTIGDGTIKKGKFLDINKTNIWKAEQVIKIAKLFDEGKINKFDKFFITDGWSFIITALKYMSQLNNIPVGIYTYFHAGTWDDNDFVTQAGLRPWAKDVELGWIKACNAHFVATKYHKKLMVDYFGPEVRKKIWVVGFPMNWKYEIIKEIGIINPKKENLIVFPHRLDKEKQPQVFDEIKKRMKNDLRFIKTLQITKTKQEYYELISKAKIVFSANLQETYGIGTVEAVMLGAIPVVPNRLSYLEMYPCEFRYLNTKDAMNKIRNYIRSYDKPVLQRKLKVLQNKLHKTSIDSVKRMMRVMLGE